MSKNRATALNGHFTGTSEIGEAATFVGLAPIANPSGAPKPISASDFETKIS
jgi:hypothetical protein